MASWDFSESTDAELAALAAAINTRLLAILAGPKSGSLDGGSFSEFSPDELRDFQSAVNAERRTRGIEIDDSLIAVEFEEADDRQNRLRPECL